MLEEKNDNLLNAEGNEEIISNKENESLEEQEQTQQPTDEDVLVEIDATNAEDAEDEENHKRHAIPLLDYHSMDLNELNQEFEKLLKNEKVQAIKQHVDDIKSEFDLKFQELIEEKKEEFFA